MEEIRETAANALHSIVANSAATMETGDYIGDGGLLYCGKCHTRKERVVTFPAGLMGPEEVERKVPCVCTCRQEAMAKEKQQEEYREKMARIQRIRDASMMESKYRDARFSSYTVVDQNRKVFQIASKYAANFRQMLKDNQGLIFWGPVGTGKSFTAACIANELLAEQIPVIMTSFVKILQNLQAHPDEAAYISMLNNASLLVLDDLGTERNTDYALEKVYNVIDSRSREAKPMVLTTNLTLSEMLEVEDIRYKRIYDRIFETCLPVEVSGESFRKISAERRFDKMAKFMQEG
ncbi:primosomal protein DnaI [Lachnospiraceae bacterium]|nr:primosomal protein DnaI [Lachnospiraceae bacterium]